MVNVSGNLDSLLPENGDMGPTEIDLSSGISDYVTSIEDPFEHEDRQINEPITGHISDTDIIDRYARLINEKREIEKELETLKIEVVRLSKIKDSETLMGKTAALRVKITNSIKFPLARDPLRKDLEDILKESGKWIDVSTLSTIKLSKQFKSNEWDADLRETISSFSHQEESIRVLVVNL